MQARELKVLIMFGKALLLFFLLNVFLVVFPSAILSLFAIAQPKAILYSLFLVLGSSLLSPSPLSLYLSLKVLSGESLKVKIRYSLMLLIILTIFNYGWANIKGDIQIQAMMLENAAKADMYKDLLERMKGMNIIGALLRTTLGFALVIPPILFLDNLNIGGGSKKAESKEKAEVHR